ncbi:hypothetical protein C8R43DRAFT_1131580 [Mycena crocata]|nr:hypothetical protein C8R43DRAFT_1131580 [Mycena crocata]
MPTTSSTTSLIAGGGDDLDDDSCLRLIPRPTTLSSSSPMFRSKSPASRGSLPSDVVLAVSGSTDALGALSAESADFGLVLPGTQLGPPRYPDNALAGLGRCISDQAARRGSWCSFGTPRSSFPTVELGLTRFPPSRHSRHPHLLTILRWQPDGVFLDQTMSGELCSLIRVTFVHFMRNPRRPRHDPDANFVCIVGLTSSPSRSCTQLTLKRSGGLWLLNSNLGSKLLAFENLDYELGDRPQEPLIIFKFWTRPSERLSSILGKDNTLQPDLLRRSKAGTIALKVLLHESLDLLDSSHLEGRNYPQLSHGPLVRFDSLLQKPRELTRRILEGRDYLQIDHGPLPRLTGYPFNGRQYLQLCGGLIASTNACRDYGFRVSGWLVMKRLNSCLEVQVKLVAFLDTVILILSPVNWCFSAPKGAQYVRLERIPMLITSLNIMACSRDSNRKARGPQLEIPLAPTPAYLLNRDILQKCGFFLRPQSNGHPPPYFVAHLQAFQNISSNISLKSPKLPEDVHRESFKSIGVYPFSFNSV